MTEDKQSDADKIVGSTDGLGGVLAIVDRREWLRSRVPPCPKCGEHIQIQMTGWCFVPADWKCRICNHWWIFEPPNV